MTADDENSRPNLLRSATRAPFSIIYADQTIGSVDLTKELLSKIKSRFISPDVPEFLIISSEFFRIFTLLQSTINFSQLLHSPKQSYSDRIVIEI